MKVIEITVDYDKIPVCTIVVDDDRLEAAMAELQPLIDKHDLDVEVHSSMTVQEAVDHINEEFPEDEDE